jgi:hypothetical protein
MKGREQVKSSLMLRATFTIPRIRPGWLGW